MPLASLIGSRLRDQRVAQGVRQADLADQAGISASYLNLIEHNRRKISDTLLARIAQALGLPVEAFSGPNDQGLTDALRSAAAESGEVGSEVARADEFAARFPGWAAALVSYHQRGSVLARTVEALNDRMSHDPHLSASLHEVLSAVASVRSTAAILAETDDIDPEWRARFHRNLHQDSERLAAGAEALVGYLDASAGQVAEQSIATPQEELELWAQDGDWAMEGDPGTLATGAARQMARVWHVRLAADREALPDAALLAAFARSDDPFLLAAETGLPVMQVFRRMALRKGSEYGLVVCDASGTLTFRKPVAGFALPRFGAACPLWPLFTALGRPMSPVETFVQTIGSDGRRFHIHAFCQPSHPQGYRGPELREAAMLIRPSLPGPVDQGLGSSCRICQRGDCLARREPSILTEWRAG